ncbi:MAG: DUF2062 domain-containing protein [Spirochaetia bacterium]|nr:DUF2062 domain-containing protein [Spirochaetia bacterium]
MKKLKSQIAGTKSRKGAKPEAKSATLKNLESEHKNWFGKKYDYFLKIIMSLLLQGISPQKIALALAMGVMAGSFPLIGTHTFIGIGLAFIFGLNQVAVYLGVWLSIPVYILILLPSLRVGEFLFKAQPMEIDNFLSGLKIMFNSTNDFFSVWSQYGNSILHLVVGWIPFAVITGLSVYFITFYFSKIILQKKNNKIK